MATVLAPAPPPSRASLALPSRVRVLYVDDEDDLREVFDAVFADTFDITTLTVGLRQLRNLALATRK